MTKTQSAATDILKKNERLLKVVQETTANVFATMLGVPVVLQQVSVEQQGTMTTAGLIAMVGMAGPVSGSGSVCMSKSFGCYVASRLLMAEYQEVDDDVLDAVAEVTNMIIGGLKSALEEDMGPMGLSIPTVVFGESYVTRSPSVVERMVLSFQCKDEGVDDVFTVALCLVSENQNRGYLRELAEFHARLT